MTKGRYRFVGISGRAPAACTMATYRPEYESIDDMYVPYGRSGASTAARIVSDALHSSDDLHNKSRRKDDRLMREVNERLNAVDLDLLNPEHESKRYVRRVLSKYKKLGALEDFNRDMKSRDMTYSQGSSSAAPLPREYYPDLEPEDLVALEYAYMRAPRAVYVPYEADIDDDLVGQIIRSPGSVAFDVESGKDRRSMAERIEVKLESSTLPRPVSTIRRTTRGTSLPPRPVGRKPLTCVAANRLVSNTSDIIAESDVYLESSPPRVTAPARKPPNHRVKIRMLRAASVPPRPMKEHQVKQAAMKGRFKQPKAKPTKALKGRPNDYILEKLMTRSNDEFQLESRPTASRTYESKPARPFTSFPVNKIPAPRVEVNNYEYQRLMRPENRYIIHEEPNLPLPSTYSRMRDSVRGLHDKMDQHRLMLDRYIVTDLKPDPLDTRSRVEARSEQLLRSAHLRSPRGHRAASAEPYNSSSSRPMSEVRSHIRDVICRTRKDPLYYH